jgi:hypothetical protein
MLTATKYTVSNTPPAYWQLIEEHGNIYNSRAYLEAMVANGMNAFVVVVYENNEMVGGATVTLGGRISGIAVNGSAHFGPVVKDHRIAGEALTCIAKAIKGNCLFFTVYVHPHDVSAFEEHPVLSKWRKRRVTYLNWDITPDMDCLWKELPKGKKSSVNRAKREEVKIEKIASTEQIEQFYKLHTMSMTRGEKAAQPSLDYFKNMFNFLGAQDSMAGFLALHPTTREPIAAVTLLLGPRNEATYWAVGQDYTHRNLGATDFLVWHCLQFLKDKGYAMFDLVGLPEGNSSRAEGIRHFKMAWSGANGRKVPSCVITTSNFKLLNPSIILPILNSLRKVSNLFRRGSKPQ